MTNYATDAWTGRSVVDLNIENETFIVWCSSVLSLKPKICKFFAWQTLSENSTKVRAGRAARLFNQSDHRFLAFFAVAVFFALAL